MILEGANTFLKVEFTAIGIFMVIFAIILITVVEKHPGEFYTTFAFFLGGLTSLLAGYIGMWISVRANVRTTKLAHSSLEDAFVMAFRFLLVSLPLLLLFLSI